MDPKLARRLNLVSTICYIGLGGLPHERAVFFAPEHDPGAGGGGGGGGEQKKLDLTQEALDKIIESRLAAQRKSLNVDELKTQAERAKQLEADLTKEREERELAGKTAAEKATIEARKAAEKIQAEKAASDKLAAEAQAERDEARTTLKSHIMGSQVADGLIGAKVFTGTPNALVHARQAFLSEAEIETDDKHAVTSVKLSGVAYPSVAKAAEEWLKSNPHFAASPAGGTGSRGQGGGSRGGKPLHELSNNDLLALDSQSKR